MRAPCGRPPEMDRLDKALQLSFAHRLKDERAARQPIGAVGDNDTVRLGFRLYARGERRRDADDFGWARKTAVLGIGNNDTASRHADSQPEIGDIGTSFLAAPFDQLKGASNTTFGGILERLRQSEIGATAIALDPVHIAIVAPDHRDRILMQHALHAGEFFRVEAMQKLGRADDVIKESGYLPAFTRNRSGLRRMLSGGQGASPAGDAGAAEGPDQTPHFFDLASGCPNSAVECRGAFSAYRNPRLRARDFPVTH